MLLWAFAFGAAHVAAYPFALNPLWLAVGACVLAWIWCRGIPCASVALSLVLGAAIGSGNVNRLADAQLSPEWDGTDQRLEFQIVSLPRATEHATSFVALVTAGACSEAACPDPVSALIGKKVRLSWYRSPELSPGQLWSAEVRLKRPRGFVNPGGFDYQAWLLQEAIVATGYVRQDASYLNTEWVWAQVRGQVASSLFDSGREYRHSHFYTALLIGDKSSLSHSHWSVLQATGTVHLMAISGLHIGLVALLGLWLGKLLARGASLLRARSGSGATIVRWVPPLFSVGFACAYAALAGFSVPTTRACIAVVLLNTCLLVGIRLPAVTALGACVVAVVLTQPLAWENNGFWLSFGAVSILIYSFAGRRSSSLMKGISAQVALAVGLLVPLGMLNQGASWVSPAANLIAVPVVSFIVVPGLLLAAVANPIAPGLARSVLAALDWTFDLLWLFLQRLGSVENPLWWPDYPWTWSSTLFAGLGILMLLAPSGLRLRGLGAICMVALIAARPPPPFALRLTVMDVGQGLAVVIQGPKESWVYDAGPRFSASFDTGSRVVAPYLRSQGVRNIGLIISHGDNDHSGGASGLMESIRTDHLYYGEPFGTDSLPGQQCEAGQMWRDSDVLFEVLWPEEPGADESNRTSCVVLLTLTGAERPVRVLLTGDIDSKVERVLLPQLPRNIDVLIAPHHGSKSASSRAFVQHVNPAYIVFSAGYRNRYKHPSHIVVERYQQIGATTLNTATDGALVFTWFDEAPGAPAVSRTRRTEAKLWHAPVASD